jgi:hypothetical protein
MFEIMESKRHGPLKGSSSIFQTKKHLTIRECTPWKNECCFVLVFGFYLYLIISQKTIHEIKGLATYAFIDYMVNKWCGEIIFWTGFVQIMEVRTYTNCTLFFVNWHGVSHPLGQMDGVDKTCLEQFLYFNLNSCFFLRINQTNFLPNRFSVRISRDFVFNNFWIDAWHFLVRPRKNVIEFLK